MLKHHEINFSWLQAGDFGTWKVMQFTGLLDKNGKEIYEGDIIEAEDPRFESGVYKYEIVFTDNAFGGNDHQGGFFPLHEWTLNEKEIGVIGNIYKNPELLRSGYEVTQPPL